MPRLFLRDAKPGDIFEDTYVLSNKQLAAASNGKPYLKALVGDRSATLNARWWSCSKAIFDDLPDGGFVRLRGRVENYQNNLQVVIEQAWPPEPGSYDPAELIAHTTRDIPQMFARLTTILSSVRNRHLSAILAAYLGDEQLMADFRHAPAAQSFHHAFLGGLLEHTLNAVEVADAVCPFYPGLNRDLVVAGIFLHDIAKTWELTYDMAFGYSDGGQLVGHIVKAAMWVDQKRRQAEATLGEPVPQVLVDVLQHIILSHHGEHQFGSPKLPMTPEAIVVHMVENMDAKLMMALSCCRGEGGGTWTEYQKAFGGRMFRPDVAPADGPPPPAPLSRPRPAPRLEPKPAAVEPAAKLAITNPLFESMDAKRR
jgi:3'-5' exoribonuclease